MGGQGLVGGGGEVNGRLQWRQGPEEDPWTLLRFLEVMATLALPTPDRPGVPRVVECPRGGGQVASLWDVMSLASASHRLLEGPEGVPPCSRQS